MTGTPTPGTRCGASDSGVAPLNDPSLCREADEVGNVMSGNHARSRVLVTGAAGFIGSHLSEALVAEGYEVVGVDALIPYYDPAVKRGNLARLGTSDAFTFVEADLRTADLDAIVDGIDVIVHEAAMPGLVESWEQFELYSSCNTLALKRLLDAAVSGGVQRFVHASTSSVYGRNAVGDESMPRQPVSPYGITKLAAEHLVATYTESFGLPGVILRYFSVYGPRQRPDMAFSIFIDRVRAGQPVRIFGDGTQSRSSTYVADCVRGTIQAMRDAEVGEVYNIGGGDSLTLNEALEIISGALGVTPTVHHEPRRAGDQDHTRADFSKAAAAFGYTPATSPAVGLKAQVDDALARVRGSRRFD